MIPRLQKLLIILLVLLQFTAPLVHAHTGSDIAELGVHVPGLESLSVGADLDKISSDHIDIYHETSLVGISAAIQQKSPITVAPASLYIDLPNGSYCVSLDISLLNFSPPETPPVPDLLVSPHFARAPPRQ